MTLARTLDARSIRRDDTTDAYRALFADYSRGYRERVATLASALQEISALALALVPSAEVYGRLKSFYSAWCKARRNHLDLEQVLDVVGVRVVVATIPETYSVVERVHDRFEIEAAEFNDYIRNPKPNGYRSLHTTLHDHDGHTVELQVRTQQMHAVAQWGSAAHCRYKRQRQSPATQAVPGADLVTSVVVAGQFQPMRCAG